MRAGINSKIRIKYFFKSDQIVLVFYQFQIFVYPRSKSDEIPSKLLNHPNITYFDASLLEVSATEIRKGLKQNEVVAKWLPNGVDAYLKNNTLTDL